MPSAGGSRRDHGDSFPASRATCPCTLHYGPEECSEHLGRVQSQWSLSSPAHITRNQWPVTWPSALSLEVLGVWEGARGSRCSLGPCFSFLPVPEKSPEGSALTCPCPGWGGGRSCSARPLFLGPSGEQSQRPQSHSSPAVGRGGRRFMHRFLSHGDQAPGRLSGSSPSLEEAPVLLSESMRSLQT